MEKKTDFEETSLNWVAVKELKLSYYTIPLYWRMKWKRKWKMKWKLGLYTGYLCSILFGDTMVPSIE